MSETADKALRTVDILYYILLTVDSQRDLASCARVNRLWSQEAIPMLWRGKFSPDEGNTPPLSKLIELAINPDRFRFLMGCVKHLSFHDDRADFAEIDSLAKDQLWAAANFISVQSYLFVWEPQELVRFVLQPSVRSLEIPELICDQGTFELVQSKCPHLKSLRVFDRIGRMKDEDFVEFLKAMPQIEYLDLQSLRHLTTEPVLIQIAKMPNLQHLRILFADRLVERTVLKAMLRAPWNLRCLWLAIVYPPAVQKLLPNLPGLEKITIVYEDMTQRLYDIHAELIKPLTYCRHLTNIRMEGGFWDPLFEEDVVELTRACPLIRELHLMLSNCNWSREPLSMERRHGLNQVTPKTLILLADALPQLQVLHFPWNIDVPLTESNLTSTLGALGYKCPELRSLILRIRFDIFELGEEPALVFPNLESLLLMNFLCSSKDLSREMRTISKAKSILQKLMPRLVNIGPWGRGANSPQDELIAGLTRRLSRRNIGKEKRSRAPTELDRYCKEVPWRMELRRAFIVRDTDLEEERRYVFPQKA